MFFTEEPYSPPFYFQVRLTKVLCGLSVSPSVTPSWTHRKPRAQCYSSCKTNRLSVFGKFTDSVNLFPTAYWWLAFSSDLVVGCGIPCLLLLGTCVPSFVWPHFIRVLKLCQALFETFFIFCFALVFVSFLLLYTRNFRSSCLVVTGTLYTCSPSMSSSFLKKVFKKILTHWL